MSKNLRTTTENVKTTGYTINYDGRKAYIRTTHKGIITVLQVLDQLRRGAK